MNRLIPVGPITNISRPGNESYFVAPKWTRKRYNSIVFVCFFCGLRIGEGAQSWNIKEKRFYLGENGEWEEV